MVLSIGNHESPSAHEAQRSSRHRCVCLDKYERSGQDSWHILMAACCYRIIHDPPLPRSRKPYDTASCRPALKVATRAHPPVHSAAQTRLLPLHVRLFFLSRFIQLSGEAASCCICSSALSLLVLLSVECDTSESQSTAVQVQTGLVVRAHLDERARASASARESFARQHTHGFESVHTESRERYSSAVRAGQWLEVPVGGRS